MGNTKHVNSLIRSSPELDLGGTPEARLKAGGEGSARVKNRRGSGLV